MKIKRFQQGGVSPEMAEAAPVPEQGGQEEMMAQLQQLAQQLIEQLGPEASAILAQMIMEMLQGAQQEASAVPEEQQFMRRGGKIVKKACRGSKLRK